MQLGSLRSDLHEIEVTQGRLMQQLEVLGNTYPRLLTEFEDNLIEVLDSQMSIFDQQTQDLIECNQQQARQIAELLRRQQELDEEIKEVSDILRKRPTLGTALSYLIQLFIALFVFLRRLLVCRRS